MKRTIRILVYGIQPLLFFMAGGLLVLKSALKYIRLKHRESEKNHKLYLLASEWIKKRQMKKGAAEFFRNHGFHSAAIYGMGILGERLAEELKEENIDICYGIDRRDIPAEFPIYKIDDDLPEADVIIVTAVYEFEEIEEILKKKTDCPIYSLEDIICFMC